jgi:hypothetical protein
MLISIVDAFHFGCVERLKADYGIKENRDDREKDFHDNLFDFFILTVKTFV